MKRHTIGLSLALTIIGLLLLTACPPQGSAIDQAIRANGDLAAANASLHDFAVTAHQSGTLNDAEFRQIEDVVLAIAVADTKVTATLATVRTNGVGWNAATIAAVRTQLDAVKQDLATGKSAAYGLKNADSRQRAAALVGAVEIALNAFVAAIPPQGGQ